MNEKESIQWKYESTPEREKSFDLAKRFLGAAVYGSIVVYAIVIYFDYQSGGALYLLLIKIFAAAYLIELVVWHRFLRDMIGFKERNYTLNDNFLEINYSRSGEKDVTFWSDFVFVAEKIPHISETDEKEEIKGEKVLYLGLKGDNVINLPMDEKIFPKVREYVFKRVKVLGDGNAIKPKKSKILVVIETILEIFD